jgi:hypothetical protein
MSEESVNNGGAAERQRGIRLTVLAIVAVGIVLVAGFFMRLPARA